MRLNRSRAVCFLVVCGLVSTNFGWSPEFAGAVAPADAQMSWRIKGCLATGVSTEPATTRLPADLNAPGCLFDDVLEQAYSTDHLPISQPVSVAGQLPFPLPGYHHLGTWNGDVVLERAFVHSSQLVTVGTRAGECFWRTAHLVHWRSGAKWVESGLFRCGRGPYVIFVFVWWGPGSPGYVIGPEVQEGASVTTFHEWECTNNTNLVSGGYFNQHGDKVYLIRYLTGTSPCVRLQQTDNNGEAYTVPNGRISNFQVLRYTAEDTLICSKSPGRWACDLWDKKHGTFTVEQLETYELNWMPVFGGAEVTAGRYYHWVGHGRPPLGRPNKVSR